MLYRHFQIYNTLYQDFIYNTIRYQIHKDENEHDDYLVDHNSLIGYQIEQQNENIVYS